MRKKICCYIFLLAALLTACNSPETLPNDGTSKLIPTLERMDKDAIESRPSYIEALRPPEYYKIPISLYRFRPKGLSTHHVQDYDSKNPSSFEYGYQSSICVNLYTEPLIQEGDLLTGGVELVGGERVEREEIKNRMELLVNGSPITKEAEQQSGVLVLLPTREPVGPRTEFIEDGNYCWEVPLGLGQHQVTFRFYQTSGDIKEYNWYFEIIE